MDIFESLKAIQAELDVPKSQYNSFGKYNYRNAEDILAAVKPLCKKYGCLLTVTDEMVMLGDRYYVKATATISDVNNHYKTTAYAREELTKKGMDSAQITGAASSYARKYALNGLFCLDDVKDADHGNNTESTAKPTYTTEKPQYEKAQEIFAPDIEFDGGCSECGATMTDGQKTVSTKKHGKLLCPDCRDKIKEV